MSHRPNIIDIQADFPILQKQMNGKPLAFLDSAASAQTPKVVVEAERAVYENCYANIHRGVYTLSTQTTQMYESARQTVADFINAPKAGSIIFTRNGTESINLVAQTWAKANLSKGDGILITEQEHHANIVPWQMLCAEKGFQLHVVPMEQNGAVTTEAFIKKLTPAIKLVAFPQVSNSLGTVFPVAEWVKLAHKNGAKVLVDGAQGIVHSKVDVQALDVDFYAFSGHKIYGPTGIGVLYGKPEILANMPPYQGGGDMIETVSFAGSTYAPPPARFEAGTPHFAGAIGLQAALNYVENIGMEAIIDHEEQLRTYAEEQLQTIDGVKILSQAPQRTGIITFVVEGYHPHDIGELLNQQGVAVRVGHHCAQPTLKCLGVDATIRASLGLYSRRKDIDQLISALIKAKQLLG